MKLNERRALRLSVLLWADIAENAYVSKRASKYHVLVERMLASCPCCEYYRNGNIQMHYCKKCPLSDTTDDCLCPLSYRFTLLAPAYSWGYRLGILSPQDTVAFEILSLLYKKYISIGGKLTLKFLDEYTKEK